MSLIVIFTSSFVFSLNETNNLTSTNNNSDTLLMENQTNYNNIDDNNADDENIIENLNIDNTNLSNLSNEEFNNSNYYSDNYSKNTMGDNISYDSKKPSVINSTNLSSDNTNKTINNTNTSVIEDLEKEDDKSGFFITNYLVRTVDDLVTKFKEFLGKVSGLENELKNQTKKVESLEERLSKTEEKIKMLKFEMQDDELTSKNISAVDEYFLDSSYDYNDSYLSNIEVKLGFPPYLIRKNKKEYPVDIIIINKGREIIENLNVQIQSYPEIFIKDNFDSLISKLHPNKPIIIRKTVVGNSTENNVFEILLKDGSLEKKITQSIK